MPDRSESTEGILAPPVRHRLFVALAAAVLAVLLTVLLVHTAASIGRQRGLKLVDETGTARVVGGLDLRKGAAGEVSRWTGALYVARSGSYAFEARTDGAFRLVIGDTRVLSTGEGETAKTTPLQAGLHPLRAEFEPAGETGHGRIVWGPAGTPLVRMAGDDVFLVNDPAIVKRLRVRRWLRTVNVLAWLAALISAAIWLFGGGASDRAARYQMLSRRSRAAAIALLGLIVVYGAVLRFEALVGRYSESPPAWASDLQLLAQNYLHNPVYRWTPNKSSYEGDPTSYRRFAREMRSFYAAHVREPFFVAATKLGLWLVRDHDIGINVTSAFFSTLAIVAVYLAGAAAYSRGVGLAAAFLWSVERGIVGLSVEGWRDDTFACAVIFSVWAFLRLRRNPSTATGLIAGTCCAVACLTRVSGLTFVVPCLLWLIASRGPSAGAVRRAAGIAAVTVLVLLGPYLISCWRAYGDPFYAVNYHTGFYQARANLGDAQPVDVGSFLGRLGDWRRLAGTALYGVTVYPFANKWGGFDYISPVLSTWLPRLAILGLALMFLSPAGRLLLVALLGSIVPYAFTYGILGGAEWRFTLVAYPFYLIATPLPLFLLWRTRCFPGPDAHDGPREVVGASGLAKERVDAGMPGGDDSESRPRTMLRGARHPPSEEVSVRRIGEYMTKLIPRSTSLFCVLIALSFAVAAQAAKAPQRLSPRTKGVAAPTARFERADGRYNADGSVATLYRPNFRAPSRAYSPGVIPAALSEKERHAIAQGAARMFLQARHDDLRLDRDSVERMVTTSVRILPELAVVRLSQRHQGLPVYGSDIAISLRYDGTILFVSNDTVRGLARAGQGRGRGKREAIAIARAYSGQAPMEYEALQRMIYHDVGGRTRIVWQVNADDWELLVDDATGEVVRAEDKALYADGTGTVFYPDPLSSTGSRYGDPGYVDGENADTPELTAALVSVTLRDIASSGGNFSLEGPWAACTEIEKPRDKACPSQASSAFNFTRSHLNFDAVNGYYHIDSYMRYVNVTLGLPARPTKYSGGVRYDPHGLKGADNAFFSTKKGGLIVFGEGGVDDAQDADVLIHELGHGLHHWITNGGLSQVEGLSEGSGDYAAASYSRDFPGQWQPTDEEFFWVFNWDGHNPFWPGRVTNWNLDHTYPDNIGSGIHTQGQYWSSCNLVAREAIGGLAMDKAFWTGISMTSSTTSQKDAAQAVLTAAQALGHSDSQIGAIADAYNSSCTYNVTIP